MTKSITLKPRMSEKAYAMSQSGVYVFNVDKDANKHEIADTVAKTYDVTVENVRIIVVKGKQKRVYRNRKFEVGRRATVKKAYVTLKAGDQIPIFAAVEEAEQEAEVQTEKVEKAIDKKAKKTAKKEKKEK